MISGLGRGCGAWAEETAAWSPSDSARAASASRTERPRTDKAIIGQSSALLLVMWPPNGREVNGPGELQFRARERDRLGQSSRRLRLLE